MIQVQSALDWQAVLLGLWFVLAVGLLDRFDISLPRGDSIGVSGALVASAVVVAGPVTAAVAAATGVAVTYLGKGQWDWRGLRTGLLVRTAALSAAIATVSVLTAQLGTEWTVVVAVGCAAAYLAVELLASQAATALATHRPIGRLIRGNTRRQASVIAAQISASALVVLIYPDMRAWSLLPVVALLLLMRQSYALLLDMRETYGTTVAILVEAAEGQDSRLHGHAERTAHYARMIGSRIGLSVGEVERLGYCALLHDVDMISESARDAQPAGSSVMLEGVTFFLDLMPVLRVCDGRADADVSEETLQLAMIVALASDIDLAKTPDAAPAHSGCTVASLASLVPKSIKARSVSAAIELGFETPAVV